MIGRVVHYRSRRILIFCGERSHDLHPVYGIVDTGAAVGEEAEARTYQSNKFHEAESAVALGASNEGHITSAAKLPDIESGLSLGQSADAAAYVNVYASVSSGIFTENSVETVKTDSAFSEAESGITTSEDIEAIKTSVAKLAESDEVIAVGGNSEGFVTSHHNEAEAGSGVATLQDAEAYVDQPSQTVISAGVYGGNSGVPFPIEACEISLPLSYILYYDQWTASSIEIEAGHSIMAWRDKLQEDGDYIGAVDENGQVLLITGDDPALFNGTITVTADTQVTETEYRQFHKYFVLVNGN